MAPEDSRAFSFGDEESRVLGWVGVRVGWWWTSVASWFSKSPQVTIMFADIVGFTSLCQKVSASVVMDFLNNLYSPFDDLASIYNVYKVGGWVGL